MDGMGQHFTPQEYLRHFACAGEPDLIWAYAKESHEFKRLPIKNVAQASDFYSAEDERMLSDEIEAPAHEPLNKLRARQDITATDREAIALYLASMYLRGPRMKRKRMEMAIRDGRDMIAKSLQEMGVMASAEVIDRFAEPYTRPSEKDSIVRSQWKAHDVAECIRQMNWLIVAVRKDSSFVVADHPLYFNERQGIKAREAEITFPLAHNIGFIASWSGSRAATRFVDEDPAVPARLDRIARQMNRRAVFQADRFVFSRERSLWIPKMVKNRMWHRRRGAKPPAT